VRRIGLAIWLISLTVPACAHDCIDHHWLDPEYMGEMRLQLSIIGLGMFVWAATLIVGGVRRARR
jgi:hypothetical protein